MVLIPIFFVIFNKLLGRNQSFIHFLVMQVLSVFMAYSYVKGNIQGVWNSRVLIDGK